MALDSECCHTECHNAALYASVSVLNVVIMSVIMPSDRAPFTLPKNFSMLLTADYIASCSLVE
jgi:hypothetical protein